MSAREVNVWAVHVMRVCHVMCRWRAEESYGELVVASFVAESRNWW